MCQGSCKDVFPVIAILLTIAWSYYVYLVEQCLLLMDYNIKFFLYVGFFHVFLIMMLAMYFICMCRKDWMVPEKYFIPKVEFDRILSARNDLEEYNLLLLFLKRRNIRVYTRSATGKIRFCTDCQQVKPDRTHHCNTCAACVIRMDHHCPWVNNCIGFTNYKHFLMLILYSGLYCTFVFCTCFEYTLDFVLYVKHLRQLNILLLSIATLVIGVTMLALLIFHLKLIASNETTIEAMYPPTFVGANFSFDKGCADNFKDFCTRNPFFWCLPVNTAQGNGTDFDVYSY